MAETDKEHCVDYPLTVNAICPGAIQTALRANSARILGPDAPPVMGGVGASEEPIRAITPAGRRGTLEEAAAAVYLTSEAATYVTGQALVVDGGWTAACPARWAAVHPRSRIGPAPAGSHARRVRPREEGTT